MAKDLKPWPRGTYLLRCKEPSLLAAAANGHAAIWPEAKAESDGKFVRFLRDGREIYACNAAYGAANFVVVRGPD